MQVISEKVKTDKEGKLLLNLETALPETEVECIVVIHPINETEKEDLSEQTYQMLEERWENYLKSPEQGKSWEDVKDSIMKKHGL